MNRTGSNCLLVLIAISPWSYAEDINVIGKAAFKDASGRAAVNTAAGSFNQQANSHAIGQNANVSQDSLSFDNEWLSADESAFTSIESMAFAGFIGLLSVNQVSGYQNIQINAGTISELPATLADTELTLVSAAAPGVSLIPESKQAHIAQDSLSQAQGIVQLNQISGDSNVAVNQFSLQLSGGN